MRAAALRPTAAGSGRPRPRWIPEESDREAARRLAKADLARVDDFEELQEGIGRVCGGIDRFGTLTAYDVATRIGVHLGIAPKRVYMHCGTQTGAKALGLDHRQRSLDPADLPTPLRKLSAAEIEDFLCIYKGEFARTPDR